MKRTVSGCSPHPGDMIQPGLLGNIPETESLKKSPGWSRAAPELTLPRPLPFPLTLRQQTTVRRQHRRSLFLGLYLKTTDSVIYKEARFILLMVWEAGEPRSVVPHLHAASCRGGQRTARQQAPSLRTLPFLYEATRAIVGAHLTSQSPTSRYHLHMTSGLSFQYLKLREAWKPQQRLVLSSPLAGGLVSQSSSPALSAAAAQLTVSNPRPPRPPGPRLPLP